MFDFINIHESHLGKFFAVLYWTNPCGGYVEPYITHKGRRDTKEEALIDAKEMAIEYKVEIIE